MVSDIDRFYRKSPQNPRSQSSNAITKADRNPTDAKIDPYGTGIRPEPYRNGNGASILGPRNLDREKQDPDMIRPPSTDSGHLPNLKWSFADSHMKIEVSSQWSDLRVRESCRQVLCEADNPILFPRKVAGQERRRSGSFLRG